MQEIKEAQVRSLGQEDPWRRVWQPIPVVLLENPMDRGASQATVHRVTKNQAQLKQLSKQKGMKKLKVTKGKDSKLSCIGYIFPRKIMYTHSHTLCMHAC